MLEGISPRRFDFQQEEAMRLGEDEIRTFRIPPNNHV